MDGHNRILSINLNSKDLYSQIPEKTDKYGTMGNR